MPAGDLTVVDNVNGIVIATGCRTTKQAEQCILDHMRSLATEEEGETVSRSYSLFSPYKRFGDSGIKGYEIARAELLEGQDTEEAVPVEVSKVEPPSPAEDDDEEGDWDIV